MGHTSGMAHSTCQLMSHSPFQSPWQWGKYAILIAILLFAVFRSWLGTRLDSFANDEPFHIISGAYYVSEGDYRLNPEHPPLSKNWVGLFNQHLDLRPMEVLNDKRDERRWLQEIMYFENEAQVSQQRSRLAMFSFHFILGLAIGLLVWRILGFGWAVVSLLWLAIDPSISAHQPVVLTDLPLSMTLILSALTGGMFCYTWKWKWGLAFGISLGMALAVKHSALPGVGVLILGSLVMMLFPLVKKQTSETGKRAIRWGAAMIFALLTLWASYGFQRYSSEGEDMFNRSLENKIADLNLPKWKTLLQIMDSSGLFPNAYLWGLADTIRAGIEGRGDDEHLFFGELIEGRAPYLYFPGTILVKIPLALMLMVVIALGLIVAAFIRQYRQGQQQLSGEQWFAIIAILLVIAGHLGALATGRTSYGGIRHALPVVACLGILAGGITLFKVRQKPVLSVALPAVLLAIAAVMTFPEPRVWEYYNEIAGGSENSHKCFCDEGGYLGQRFYELENFFAGRTDDEKDGIHVWTWLMEEEKDASGLNFTETVVAIDKSEPLDPITGYFVIEDCNFNPTPTWDPSILDQLEPVTRIGKLHIRKGQLINGRVWAFSMNMEVLEYLMKEKEIDWELVAKRLEQSTEYMDYASFPYLLLGNAYIMLGDRDKSINAYQRSLENMTEDDPHRINLSEQIARVEQADSLQSVTLLRPFNIE